MTQSTQGIIIALLISLLIGVIIGFYLRQSRINDLSKALKQQKKQTEATEQEHEKRLQEATLQLQKDYEMHLAEKIELYQNQYDTQVNQLESEYDARLSMLGPAVPGADQTAAPGAPGPGTSIDAVTIEQQIRKQYETRLKEAAQKIQQAYEQHLKVKLNESREALQKDYEHRLAEKIEHYQDQLDEKLAQATSGATLPLGAMAAVPGILVPGAEATNSAQREDLEAKLRHEYEQRLAEKIEHYQDDMAQRIAELEQDYEARFRMMQSSQPAATAPVAANPEQAQGSDLAERTRLELEERFRHEYDQRLAEAIERYQDEMMQRTQALEQEYEARLQLAQQQIDQLTQPTSRVTDDGPSPENSLVSEVAPATQAVTPPVGSAQADQDMPLPDAESVAPPQTDPDLFSDVATEDELTLDNGREPAHPPGQDELTVDLNPSEPAQVPAASSTPEAWDLDDLLTMAQSDESQAEEPPLDDGGFDLDNLEALLQAQEDDGNPEDLFGNLDDLSNLS